jgi:sulfur carrier protein
MALTVVLNGQTREFEGLAELDSLERLLVELGVKGDRVAVERNGEIVPRALWAGTLVGEGDRLEVVHFVGGGV